MKLRSIALCGAASALLLAVPAMAQNYYNTNPTPAERAQTDQLNGAAAADANNAAATNAANQTDYNAAQSDYDKNKRNYDAERSAYDHERDRYERNARRWEVEYTTIRFRDVADMRWNDLRDIAVRTEDGDTLGHIRHVDAANDGRVERVAVNMDGERTAWIDADDLRYDRRTGEAVTDLSRRQVDDMAHMRFPR